MYRLSQVHFMVGLVNDKGRVIALYTGERLTGVPRWDASSGRVYRNMAEAGLALMGVIDRYWRAPVPGCVPEIPICTDDVE